MPAEKFIRAGKDSRLTLGQSFISLIKFAKRGATLNVKWGKWIPRDDGHKVWVARIDGLELVAWKFSPKVQLPLFFPGGALIMTISGKLIIADKLVAG